MSSRWDRNTGCPVHCFSLVVCRHPETKLWLAVNETKNRGWWLPGGFVECGDDHFSAAIRETIEEAGIHVTLKGILRVENSMSKHGGRQRVIFYAEPSDPTEQPKQTPDNESIGATWMSLEQLQEKNKLPPPIGLRGRELMNWASYIENGGSIYPLSVFVNSESSPVAKG